MRLSVFAALVLLAAATAILEAQPVKFDKRQLIWGDVPRQYRPDYPREARARHQTGSGVYVLHINSKTGAVTSISIQKSTGHELLDNAVISACAHWQFKPHTVTEVYIPLTFGLSP